MPWIYYRNTDSSQTVPSLGKNRTYGFVDSGSMKKNLEFYIKRYNLDGTEIATFSLSDELTLCSFSHTDVSKMSLFGNYFRKSCEIEFSNQFFNEEQYFYELFLKVANDKYVDIPVAIEDYRAKNGRVNSEGNQRDPGSLSFTRRFYKINRKSGIETATGVDDQYRLENGIPTVISYLREVHIYIAMDRSDPEELHVIKKPYAYLVYDFVEKSSSSSTATLLLQMHYSSDISGFKKTLGWLFAFANVLAFLLVIGKMVIWWKYNPLNEFELGNQCDLKSIQPMLLRFIANLITIWSFTMFWFMMIIAGYWYIFYKWEKYSLALMPLFDEDLDIYRDWRVIFWLTFSGLCFQAVMIIYDQSQLDFFLLDWERSICLMDENHNEEDEGINFASPEARNTNLNKSGNFNKSMSKLPQMNKGQSKMKYSNELKKSAWRSITIANEFNELFGGRHINIPFVFLLFGVVITGFKWENYASHGPYPIRTLSDTDVPESDYQKLNYVLKFFITSAVMIFIGGVYYIIKKLIVLKVATPAMNFVDLCSIANISIFIFESISHGYYIHGHNPVGTSEGDIVDLTEILNKESTGKSRGRGLVLSDKTNLQTYEFFFPLNMRKKFDNYYSELVRNQMGNEYINNASQHRRKMSLPPNINIKRLQAIHVEMGGYLRHVIKAVTAEANTNILDKTGTYRFSKWPPVDIPNFGAHKRETIEPEDKLTTPIFLRDPEISFENVMSFGQDFKLLLINVMFYQAMDLATRSTYQAIFITFLIEMIYVKIKVYYQTRNFSQRTFIDELFLL